MKVRMRLRRVRLTAVRLAILRVIFLADRVLAMGFVLVSEAAGPTGVDPRLPGAGMIVKRPSRRARRRAARVKRRI